jgi:hypothetical protein
MKNILFVVFISMIFLFVCCNTTTNKNIIETEISDFDKILDSFQVNGSILIYDNDKNTFTQMTLIGLKTENYLHQHSNSKFYNCC